MKLDELKHVLRASAAIASENSMVDLTVSKCVAGREKDADFVRELLKLGLVSAATLKERIAMLEETKYPLAHIREWVERRQIEANTAP